MSKPTVRQRIVNALHDLGDLSTSDIAEATGVKRNLVLQSILWWRKSDPTAAPRVRRWERRTGTTRCGKRPEQVWTLRRVKDAEPLPPEPASACAKRYREKMRATLRAKGRGRYTEHRAPLWLLGLLPAQERSA